MTKRDIAAGIVFDWVLSWQSPGKSGLLLSLEIDNVFNRRLETVGAASEYEVGRQFWAGGEWRF